MRKGHLLILIIFSSLNLIAQNTIEWSPENVLKISDYQSASTEISDTLNMYMINSGAQMDFSYAMSTYEFMFTKNFNSKVKTLFHRNQSALVAPNIETAERLVQFGQFEFDLTELYSRKLRKKLYESKGAFSSADFFKPLYEELHAEMVERHGKVGKESDVGNKSSILEKERAKVLEEINFLSDFCLECKPPKRKKKKK